MKKTQVCSLKAFCRKAEMKVETHKVRTYKEYHSVCPSSELGLPQTPHPQASVPPPPCFWGEGNTRWRERGWELVPIPTRGIHCGTLYMYVLCVETSSLINLMMPRNLKELVLSEIPSVYSYFIEQPPPSYSLKLPRSKLREGLYSMHHKI
jgi:hypothetical protein